MTSDQTARDELLRLEEARCDAITSEDWVTLEGLIDDDLYYCHTNGKVESKSEYLNNLQSESRRAERAGTEVRLLGDIAIVTGRIEFIFESRRFWAAATEVWIKRVEGWRLTAFQAAKIDPEFV